MLKLVSENLTDNGIFLKYFLTTYLQIAKRKGVTLNRENQIIKEWDKSRCAPLNGIQ